ncbi:mixed lineage kinase domain-like protein [Sparus aurata]|uniref:mixed lineage kinase domain-like protein n=1 Tax=Sparus aurata TaxID=8175 RepID=UPI0011C13482|nr:mixed lineage kinase domain-like protein [Sparus aurata]
MDLIQSILSIASQIYTLVETVNTNKKRCRRVSERVKALEDLVGSIKQRVQAQTSANIEKALKELSFTLESAQELIMKFTTASWIERTFKSSSYGDDFNSLNERLNDAFQVLSGALQVEQGNLLFKVFEQATRERQDEDDRREDEKELRILLIEHLECQQKAFEELKTTVQIMQKFLEIMNNPRVTDEGIKEINPEELKYELPKEPFMTTSTSEVYRGEYNGFQVAIKRYTDLNTSSGAIKSVFKKETETMKRFESPNILRMFGICVQEEGPRSQFLVVMEYCERGSLRQVLDSCKALSWTRKACMCLDAAKGLYRLHQTEEKSKVHGSINSCKFLVAKDYTVKLGGFELAKTETSLKNHSAKNSKKDQEISPLCYCPPEVIKDINPCYSKEWEMYSFGIVLWEIATCEKPFAGCSDKDIQQKVFEEKFQEPLPEDCPKPLGDLINACRAYESFQRPSAGVLMDRLRILVAQLKE